MTPSPLNPPSETAVAKDDYDTPWKDAVTRAFREFIAFDFPDAHRQIDWHRGYTFLDQDLVDPNPFALVTAAHLLTQQTRGDDQQRLAAKWRLAKLLYERNWDKQRIIDLFSVIDWMMQVPDELQNQLWQDIEQLERNRTMPYITSVERIGIEKGRQQGMQQGMQQGEAALLERQLTRRFGPPSADTLARL